MSSVLVTGANRGIGLEFARQYRAEGRRVIATVRRPETAGALEQLGAEVHVLEMRDAAGIARLGHRLAEVPIDVLIANAGVYEGRDVSLDDTDEHYWVDAFRINTMAPLLLARAFRGQVRRGGERKMVAVSSALGSLTLNRIGGHYAYRSSKAALNAAWRALALDAPDLICVLLRPGWVRTDMSGPGAELSPEESVAGMRRVIAGLTPAQSGKFLDYRGEVTAW